MKKSVLAMMLGMLLIWTAACGNAASSAGANVDTLTPVQVSVSTDPATLHSHQTVEIQAKVTQGSGNVDDAEEVEFQVWEDGHQEQSETIAATREGQGLYSIRKTFEHAGTYEVTAHVTARGMHTMPTRKLVVVE